MNKSIRIGDSPYSVASDDNLHRRWRNIMSYTALWWGFEAKEDSRWQQRPR